MAEQTAQEIIDSLVAQLQKSNSEKIGMQVKIDGLTKQVNESTQKEESNNGETKEQDI
jgi:hypothetical protein|tara:strand:- start:4229 stop:4402 length:174 start_codon:yes stop_codon:yes gene_type:complete